MLQVCKTDICHQMWHQKVGSLIFLLEIPVIWVNGIEQVYSTTEEVADLVDHCNENIQGAVDGSYERCHTVKVETISVPFQSELQGK